VSDGDQVYFWIAEQFVALGLPLALLFSGLGSRICKACRRLVHGRWFWTATLFATVYVLLSLVLTLPIDYVAFRHVSQSGLPGQSLESWGLHELGSAARLTLIGSVLGWIPFWLIRSSPKHWWLWAGVAGSIVAALVLTVRPIWIDPLTAHYAALEDGPWRERIDRLGQRVGIEHVAVLIQHASQRGACDNITSTVEGIGPTRRLILGEDVFTHSTEREVVATVAHELKHYRLDATWKPVATASALIFAVVSAIALLSAGALRLWAHRFDHSSIADPASLPLLVLAAQLALLVATPAKNLLSQHIEHEADRFALELTHDNEAVAHEVADVCGAAVLEYGWFDQLYFYNHPSLGERVRFARSYRPWQRGKLSVYGRYIE
jgi:STE24 endopeptidase